MPKNNEPIPPANVDVPPPSKSLNEALLVAQQQLQAVGKDSKNSFHKYNYTSSEGMISACRSALHYAGLVVTRTRWTIDPAVTEFGCLNSRFHVSHPASGGEITDEVMWPIVPEKGRPYDKAVAGALTTSLNYFLRDLLQVPREEETMDNRDDRQWEPRRPAFQPERAAGGEQPKSDKPVAIPAGKPVVKPAPAQQSAAAAPGEWIELAVRFVDEGVAGKNSTPFVKIKDTNNDNYFVWDPALHGTAKASRGSTIWVMTEAAKQAGGPPRIVQIRTAPPAEPSGEEVLFDEE